MLIYLSLLETDAEKEAFLALYSQYHQAMLRLARRYFPTDQMSLEDAVQNAWVKIIRNFPKIRTLERYYGEERMYLSAAQAQQRDTH